MPPGLRRPVSKAAASTVVLQYEEELCEAVAQNKLLRRSKERLRATNLSHCLYSAYLLSVPVAQNKLKLIATNLSFRLVSDGHIYF
jgi:hypothetical protein